MKKLALVGTTLALLASAGSAMAENGLNAGTIGLSVDTQTSSMIQGRYLVSREFAILGGLSLNNQSGTGGGTTWGLMGGARYYLKNDDLAPFIGGRINYSAAPGGTSAWGIGVEGGAEYFLNKHFSLEGRVGLGYASQTVAGPNIVVAPGIVIPTTVTRTTFGTTTAALGANFYF